METNQEKTYEVARNRFRIAVDAGLKSWSRVAWHYEPFVVDGEAELNIAIRRGKLDIDGYDEIFIQKEEIEGQVSLDVYRNASGDYLFVIRQPFSPQTNGWLRMNADLTVAELVIDEDNPGIKPWQSVATVTTGMMLCYMVATEKRNTLMAHASSVIYKGKAYLFIAKSGTGKSTHTRLWGENIEGVELLNDDHPIVRCDEDGIVAYGSPWSGKTDCYKNLHAPVGAIGRIKRADKNGVELLSPIMAYASLVTSFSGITWDRQLADGRHRSIERLVSMVPCYNVNCLPDADAALLSCKTIAK